MINTPGARPVSVNPGVTADMVDTCTVVVVVVGVVELGSKPQSRAEGRGGWFSLWARPKG